MTRQVAVPLIAAQLFLSAVILAAMRETSSVRSGSSQAKAVKFKDDVAPLLSEKCRPCHFEGGKVFEKLPFDQYQTVVKVASPLNTRLKGKDADLVTRWIEAGAPE
jgi:hypothetical protein